MAKPNIVTIMADDLPRKMFKREYFPKTFAKLVDRGTAYQQAFHAVPVCDPSRVCFLTGRWVHNHRVYSNRESVARSRKVRADRDTLATRLRAAGYQTALIGKYLWDPPLAYKPPGWDLYEPYLTPMNKKDELYVMRNGERVTIRLAGGSEADYLAKRAGQYIRASENRQRPFWLHINPSSPHAPSYPAERYATFSDDERLYPSEGRRERDLSDKPRWVADDPAASQEDGKRWRGMIEEARAVDDLVGRVVDGLRATGQLAGTLVVFLSDNGYHFGEHHQHGKLTPYDEATRSPLVVRGPGFPAGVQARGLMSTLDVTPTLLRAAGAEAAGLDGRPLAPLVDTKRDYLFVENFMHQKWTIARSATHLYVRHREPQAMEELYDLASDPALNRSVSGDPEARTILADMRTRVAAFAGCAGNSCRTAEAAP